MFDTVVVATDGSDSVSRAIDVALDLAGRFDAEVHALSVVDASEVDASPQQLREELRTALETTADAALATVEDRTDREITTAARERPSSRRNL